ncbi:MAG: radical SAM domain protein [Proteobacteria bacterium]|nr:MAG: radical SAM domain protein [Pseudomonadota bacterium]
MNATYRPQPLAAAGAVNFHLTRACDSRCRFCFATFRTLPRQLSAADGRALITALRRAGAQKINFAGGEPTLHPHLAEYLHFAKGLGMTTSVITNGYRLPRLLAAAAAALDWAGLSCDTADEATQQALGRGHGDHVRRTVALAEQLHDHGVRVKLNTVVTAETWREDMSALVLAVRPERWKVFQVLPVAGQNDGDVEDLLITERQLRAFVARHGAVREAGVTLVAEDNAAMTDSYVMVDPAGRMVGNSGGRTVTSAPVLEVGVAAALEAVGFDATRLIARGGRYAWAGRRPELERGAA